MTRLFGRWLPILVFAVFAAPLARADQVPPHLIGLAKSLLAQVDVGDYEAAGYPPLARRANEAVRESRIRNWAGSAPAAPVDLDALAKPFGLDLSRGDHRASLENLLAARDEEMRRDALGRIAALLPTPLPAREKLAAERGYLAALAKQLEGLAKEAVIPLADDRAVTIEWDPASSSVLARIDLGEERGEVVLHGGAAGRVEDGRVTFEVVADADPVTWMSSAIKERIRSQIQGTWIDQKGHKWVIRSGGEITAIPDPERDPAVAAAKAELKGLRDEVARLEADKVYVWRDGQGGEVIQRKFKRLPEPFLYDKARSEAFHREEIDALKQRIAELEAAAPPVLPVDSYDPLGLAESGPASRRPLEIEVIKTSGYQFVYDEAAFDGRRITASRTLRDMRDITENPEWVIRELIASWSPPEWIELSTKLNPRDRSIVLEGHRWRLHVTYSMGMTGGGSIDGIHTPYSEPLSLSRPGHESDRPSFRIGEVVVETADRFDRIADASDRLNEARNAVASSQKLLDETRAEFEEEGARFWEIHNREQQRIRPLEEAYRSQMAPLLRAERDRIASISATTAAEADRTERMRRRVEVIGERLSLDDDVYGGAENARIQKARLAAERDDLVARLARIDAGPRPRTEEQLRATSERAEELFDRWDLEKRHSDRVIARAGRDLEMVANQVRRLRADVASDEKELGEAIAEWQDVKDDSELAIGQVSSADYRARFVSELPELAKLNSLIAEMRRGIGWAELAHEHARREMLDQGRSVEAASMNLINASYASAIAQTEVEFIDQAVGFIRTTAKAGPHAALAEAVHTMFWNVASPPTVFDASSSPFSITAKEDSLVEKVLTEGAKVASKMYPIDQKIREDTAALIESDLSRQLGDRMPDIRAGNLDAVDGLSTELKKQLKALKEIQEEIDVYALRKGVRKLATSLSLDIAQGQVIDAAKGYVKDEIKKTLAELLEGPAVGRYLEEQIQLVHAVRKFRVSGNMAWHLRDQLALLVPERDALLEKYDSEAGLLVDKNRQFLAGGGYAFFLYSSDDMKNPNERDSSDELEAKVYLQGIELVEKPSGHGRKFTIRTEDEERFDSTFPEMLTLKIKLQ